MANNSSKNIALKIFLKKIVLVVLSMIGYLLLTPIWLGRRKNKLVVLRYHSVSDFRRHEVNVKINKFRKQMGFLAKYYKPVSLSLAVDSLSSACPLARKAVAVTFDDGYKDNFTNAYPVLKALQIPAAIFLSAGYIGTDRILAHDIADEPRYNYLLNWDEVRVMSRGGIEFGSHTINHANLGAKGTDIKNEIEESRRVIEKELASGIKSISYPFGLLNDFNEEVKLAVKKSGYVYGCSAMNGVNDTGSDIFELRRIGIEASDNMFTFRAKLNGCLDILAIKDKPPFDNLLRLFNRLIGV